LKEVRTVENISTEPKIGQIYMMKFTGEGHEQVGWRPGLVVQNNKGNSFSPNIIAVPLTSSIKKCAMPTHVLINAVEAGLKMDSLVLCENPKIMPKESLGNLITELTPNQMKEVAKAYVLSSSIISFLNVEELKNVWYNARELNGVAN